MNCVIRARTNIETIVDRLTEQGYALHADDDACNPAVPFIGASEGASAFLDWPEEQFGRCR